MTDSTFEKHSSNELARNALGHGIATIKRSLSTAPGSAGVYRMLNGRGEILYVGKAKDIRKRVASYSHPNRLTRRLARMVGQTKSVEFVTTHTEAEALLLEANLIKHHRPPFNIILRDDKSFPYILLRGDHDWPQITKHRGAKSRKQGEFFGPFASAGAVNRTLNILQKIFLLRSCSDAVFDGRTRPCLLYQIKRCSAPCVGRISARDYAQLVEETRAFLRGRKTGIQDRLAAEMEEASDKLDYETAALQRDRLQALARIQQRQGINTDDLGDADIMAIVRGGGLSCIQVFFYRAGQNYGNRAYFPRHDSGASSEQILSAFIGQFYDNKPPPGTIVVNVTPADTDLLAEALSVKANHKVRFWRPVRGAKRRLIEDVEANAKQALDRRLAESASQSKLLSGLSDVFDLDTAPERIEVFDNSHISGQQAIGAMIVAGPDGFMKSSYRRFNIKQQDLAAGDDYAMIREVIHRRYSRLMKEDAARESGQWPDLVLIDGGRGQLNAALEALADTGVEDLIVAGIAKGPDREAGREDFYLPERPPFRLKAGDPVLYYLQRLRDEAHRFAIAGHRARRQRAARRSPLDDIAGIGARRKQALLHHFGSARGISEAGLKDLEAVDGISQSLAKAIYDHFHPSS